MLMDSYAYLTQMKLAIAIDHLHLSQIKNNGVSNGVPQVPAATSISVTPDNDLSLEILHCDIMA
jgi:hypothetical protein